MVDVSWQHEVTAFVMMKSDSLEVRTDTHRVTVVAEQQQPPMV